MIEFFVSICILYPVNHIENYFRFYMFSFKVFQRKANQKSFCFECTTSFFFSRTKTVKAFFHFFVKLHEWVCESFLQSLIHLIFGSVSCLSYLKLFWSISPTSTSNFSVKSELAKILRFAEKNWTWTYW